ncbi:MAG: YicC family protein [Desulfuromonadales bacterium]|nr:YicC family protein [Desulfuromonadales bacterium]
MLKSMTGYGKGQETAEGLTLTVEIRSVNHRYSDITIKVPRFLMALESELKKKVAERLRRGKIDVFVNQESSASAGGVPVLNLPLMTAYVAVLEEMRRHSGLRGEIPISLLAGQRDVILLREEEVSEGALRPCLDAALSQALAAAEKMRLAEGEALQNDMQGRLVVIEELLAQIELRAPQISREWQGKLTERLARLGGEMAVDPQRIAQEIAIFADRCDITEEVVRFRSHLQQFRALLEAAEPVGRQMDFLVQEINRETNTMGSKSNDADLTRLVVSLKAELEKVREQVQNIE